MVLDEVNTDIDSLNQTIINNSIALRIELITLFYKQIFKIGL